MTATVDAPHAPPAAASGRRRRWLTTTAGIGLATALLWATFAPLAWWPAGIGGAGMFYALTRHRSHRESALIGAIIGLLFFLSALDWVHVVATDAYLLLALVGAITLAGVGALVPFVAASPVPCLGFAALWVAGESVRSRVPFGGFPWARLGFGQAGSPLLHLAAVGSVPLVSFAVALLGALLVETISPGRAAQAPRPGLGLRRGVSIVAVLGVAAIVPIGGAGPHVVAAVIQGDVPRTGLAPDAQRWAVFTNHVTETARLAADVRAHRVAAPSFVVWPENSTDLDPFTLPDVRAQIDESVSNLGSPLLVGAVLTIDPSHLRNVGIVWSPTSGPGQIYVKRHLVPFGEYVPARHLLAHLFSQLGRVPLDFVAGSRPGVLTIGEVRIGDAICFEVAFDALVRDTVRGGGAVLVVQTNDATYGNTSEVAQQLAIEQERAIEHGRAVLVAATSGISAIIDPDGRIVDQTPQFVPDYLEASVPVRTTLTVSDRLGSIPELVIVALAVGAIAAGARRRRHA